ncbi:hypothetical protein SAMN05660461_0398 [Chitinophaga ginsengisegetis]|uniref:Uncharacterized protein n=1 Tax=Chitinophaga ginsengisegetis TaxID=393003 RepID=A0A1T5N5F0_9BACT|nr:hypothetical protein [Chitinophaga ginsengisegetis]SKC95473.1 hypothetical protein SAMN05660461_0398 [Chitinophaga ginsengisegetis]
MKNLPATIGLIGVLTLFVFFRGNPDKAQAAPVKPIQTDQIEVFAQDTFPPKPMDTVMKHKKKKDKKGDTSWPQRRDTLLR